MVPRAPTPPRFRRPPSTSQPSRNASAHSKISIPSFSPSNEADDERSSNSDDQVAMGPGARRNALYAGDDTRLTSKKELSGFYMYGWAAEVYVVCGIGSFIPITLEQLARERGVLLKDRSKPCVPLLDFDGAATNSTVPRSVPPPPEGDQCIINILGVDINTASFAMYTFSISVLVQALVIISMSGAADHGRYRKTFLLFFGFSGAIATMLFLPIVPKVLLLGAILAIVSNTCFGASFVLLNSFLPLLVRHHPRVQLANSTTSTDLGYSEDEDLDDSQVEDDGDNENVVDSTARLLPSDADTTTPNPPSNAAPSQELQLSTKISSFGMGIGYIAGLLVQALCIIIIRLAGQSTFSLRLALFVVGAWWFIFTIPTALWLRSRPGPPLHFNATGRGRVCLAYFTYAWKSLWKTIMHARNLKDVLLFLAAWFMLSDGIATVGGTAVLFAKTTMNMQPAALALINVIATVSAAIGSFSWAKLSELLGLKPSQTILACLFLFELIPLYGLLGYLEPIKRLGFLGIQQPWELYPIGAVYGFVMGGLSSYCRSLFGELIPPGFEAAFYALFAITDKGSSVFGPAIVGAITDATGDIRPAFFFLAALIGAPIPLIMLVDAERGRADGIAMARELADRKAKSTERYTAVPNIQVDEEATSEER